MSTDTATAPTATPSVSASANPSVSPNQTSATPSPQSGISEPWAKSWIQPDFTLNHTALDRLPDHLKPLRGTLEKYKGFEDVLVGMQNQQLMNGKKALAPLPSDAPEHVRTERKALLDTINGVPTSPKEYAIAKPADLPDNAWSQPAADNLQAWAHKHSVSPAAAKELMASHAELIKGQLAEQTKYEATFWSQQQTAFEAQIRQENIPADKAAALVEKGAISLGLDLTNEQTKTFLKGADARLMAMRHAIAVGEDHVVTGNSQNATGPDPEAEAADIRTNAANPLNGPYWNKGGKYSREQQSAAVEKVNGLLRQATAKPAGAKR